MRNTVIAYHGCDVTTRDSLVNGRLPNLRHSNNRYDWLGPGAYFFENDPERADLFARASYDNPAKRYTALPIATPSVVGAILNVDRWLDMTTSAFHSMTHIQIALRDNSCVVGWFLPRGALLLTERQYRAAKERLDAATVANRKPRVRPAPGPG